MRSRFLLIFVLLITSFVLTFFPSHKIKANGSWYVAADGNNENDCSSAFSPCATINGALNKPGFVSGDTIKVAIGTYTDNGDEVVLLDRNATLSGGWENTFLTRNGTSVIDGQKLRYGIQVNSEVTASVEYFTVQNGKGLHGGGIFNLGTLSITDSIIQNNLESGIANGEILTVTNSSINNNKADFGAGISNGNLNAKTVINNSTIIKNFARENGGGIYNSGGTLIVNDSTISGNTAIYNGGGIYDSMAYENIRTINNSAIHNNTASHGGGIYTSISNTDEILTINNSTISKNVAKTLGGGIYKSCNSDTLSALNNVTIVDNQANEEGGGLYIYTSNCRISIQNTILSSNTATQGRNCSGTIESEGYNLVGGVGDISNCSFTPSLGDLTNAEVKHNPLHGSPAYHPLSLGSPAIDAGNPAGCTDYLGNPLSTDQRGMSRLGRCDIGAVETQELEAAEKVVNVTSASPDSIVGYSINFGNISEETINNAWVTDTLPASLDFVHNSLTATTGTVDYNNGVISWSGNVTAGSEVQIQFDATVKQNVVLGEEVTNTAIIGADGYEFSRVATFNIDGQICNVNKHAGNPVLSIGANGSWDEAYVWKPVVLKVDDNYLMWYTGSDGSNPSQIGLASSVDGINWLKNSQNPIFSPSETWESGGVRVGGVIFDEGLYKMWYTGYDDNGVARIGYATASNGLNWIKHGDNPVLDVVYASSEDDGVRDPTVLKDGAIYHMWYSGFDGVAARIRHATSYDGAIWVKDWTSLGLTALDLGLPGDWDWLDLYSPSVVTVGDEYKLWYSGQTLPEAWQTGYATSTNGTNWIRKGLLIPEGIPGSFDSDSADHAAVIVDGANYKAWYSGFAEDTNNIGYATAEICVDPTAYLDTKVYLPIIVSSTSCNPYYLDDFSDSNSGWLVYENNDRKYAYINGEYQILIKNPSQGWMVTPGALATNFTASVRAHRVNGTNGAYGIIFGINEDWDQFYEVLIDDNAYSIWFYNNGWSALKNWTVSSAIYSGTAWNDLRVIRDGKNIILYANNQYLTTVSNEYTADLKRIGLTATSPSSGMLDVRFDDFSLAPVCNPIIK